MLIDRVVRETMKKKNPCIVGIGVGKGCDRCSKGYCNCREASDGIL